jgi:hypothetical protein
MGARLFLLLSCVAIVFSEERITVGNVVTNAALAPHAAWLITPVAATIFNSVNANCGASILAVPNPAASQWAITAAHCVAGVGPGFLRLRYGCLDRTSVACQEVVVNAVFIHPYYQAATAVQEYQYDVALLRFNAVLPGVYTGIFLATLPAENPIPGTAARFYGFGATQYNANFVSTLLRVASGAVATTDQACCENFVTSSATLTLASSVPYAGPCIGDDGDGLISNFALPPSPANNRLIGVLSYYQGCGTTPLSISTYANIVHPQIRVWIVAQLLSPVVQVTAAAAGLAVAAADVPCAPATLAACRLPTRPPIIGLTAGSSGFGGAATCHNAPFIQTGTNFVSFVGATQINTPDVPVLAECNAVDIDNQGQVAVPAIYGRYFRIVVPATATKIVIDACEIGVPTNAAYLGPLGHLAPLPQDVTIALYNGGAVYQLNCANDQFPLTCTSGNVPSGNCGGRGATLHYQFPAGVFSNFQIRLASNANDAAASGNFFVQFYDTTIPPALPAAVPAPLGGCGIQGGDCDLAAGQVCQVTGCDVPAAAQSSLFCFLTAQPATITHVWQCEITVRNAGGFLILGDLSLFTITVTNAEVEIMTPNERRVLYQFRVSNNDFPGTVITVQRNGVNIVGSPFNAAFTNINPCGAVLVAGASCTPGSAAPGGVGTVCACGAGQTCAFGVCFQSTVLTCPNPNNPQPPALNNIIAGVLQIDPTCANVGNLNFGPSGTTGVFGGIPGAAIQFASITVQTDTSVTLPDPATIGTLTFTGPDATLFGCHTSVTGTVDLVGTNPSGFPIMAHSAGCSPITGRFFFHGSVFNVGVNNVFLLRGPVTFSQTSSIGTQAVPLDGIVSITQRRNFVPPQTSVVEGTSFGAATGLLLVNYGALTIGDNNLPRNLRVMMALGTNAAARDCLTVCGASGHFQIQQGCWSIRLDCVNRPSMTSVFGISSIQPRVPIVINAFGPLNAPPSTPNFAGTLSLPAPQHMRFVINAVSPTGLAVNQEIILAIADLIVPGPGTDLSAAQFTFNLPSNIVTAVAFVRISPTLPNKHELVLRVTSIAAAPSAVPATPTPSPSPLGTTYNQNLADIPRDSAFTNAPLSIFFLLVSLMAAYLVL